jgi:hypothetical protein
VSYPDLGCFAECLQCEICESELGLPGDTPDLFPDAWPDDDPVGLSDYAPPNPPDNPLGNIDIPPSGDIDILPMNPFKGIGITVSGKW